jgi:hypothetical protein
LLVPIAEVFDGRDGERHNVLVGAVRQLSDDALVRWQLDLFDEQAARRGGKVVPIGAGPRRHLGRALSSSRPLGATRQGRLDRVVALHYDHDFDLISGITGQPTEWVVPAGSLA